MRKKWVLSVACAAIAAGWAVGTSAAAAAPPPSVVEAAVAGEIVVMLQYGATIQAVASRHRLVVLDQFGLRPIFRLKVAEGASVDAQVAALLGDPQVRFAEPNFQSQAPEARGLVVWAIGGDAGSWAAQWAPQAIALPDAQALATGAGVRVAVLDSGMDLTHPQLAPRLARDRSGRVLGRDFVDGDDDASERGGPTDAGWGHGTHVAGLVALVAPKAQLMPVRVLEPSGRGNLWALAEALLWAVDPDGNPATDDGAHVVNLSLGTLQPTRLLNTAVELATCSDDDDDEDDDDYSAPGFNADQARCNLRGGVVVISAAGNGGSATERQYPAAEGADGQLAVTASASSGRLPSFANRGPWVQIAAPGERIISTLPGGGWGVWSGSSMAAPLTAGVAALVKQRNPDWKPVDVTKRILDRSVEVCGRPSSLRALHAHGAVADFAPVVAPCR